MEPLDLNIDAKSWFDRWEAMMETYDLHRRALRFRRMLEWPGLPRERELNILDLGCGPGSLAFAAARNYPHARIVAVDADRVLLTIGMEVARIERLRVEFIEADFRAAEWWKDCGGRFDLILSAITLHWLSRRDLSNVYRHIHSALKPGGFFLNSDHFAADDPETQTRYHDFLETQREQVFAGTDVLRWNAFWQRLAEDLGRSDLEALSGTAGLFEGTDEGHPRRFHLDALRRCGFEKVEFIWQDFGEAILSAQKPK